MTSLEEIGLSMDQQGHLSLNEQKLKDKFATNQQAVEDFFTKEKTGVATRLNDLIDLLAGTPKINGKAGGKSLLDAKSQSLQARIDFNKTRIDQMTAHLDTQRLLLEKQFARMESAVAKLQSQLTDIARIQPMATSSRG